MSEALFQKVGIVLLVGVILDIIISTNSILTSYQPTLNSAFIAPSKEISSSPDLKK